MKRTTSDWTIENWARAAERELKRFVLKARGHALLRKRGSKAEAWQCAVKIVNQPAMRKLNQVYRGKPYATDVLSFVAPDVFRKQGILGELVICLPVLRRQAREMGHPAQAELRILLVHGLLHLLGEDHEKGPRQAAKMAELEAELLGKSFGKRFGTGLIARAH